jgi:inositol transport system permease protein
MPRRNAKFYRRCAGGGAGGVGRITGTVIGTIILGVVTSGFTFPRTDAYCQEIAKGMIIIAAVIADRYRQRKRRRG